ncbi:MAG: cytochrome c [Gammaproteobacteria bacterium]|nr:cytochrome c [Gammaproteobacteria bacterium]
MLERLAIALVCLLPTLAQGDVTAARRDELLHLLAHDCGSCHGMRLTGGLGPPLTADALEHRSLEAVRTAILDGRPAAGMPPWRALLSEEEAAWLAETMKRGTGNAEIAR